MAAPLDAEQRIKGVGAASKQFADQQNVLLEAEANAVALQTGLFRAAARMVGSISPS